MTKKLPTLLCFLTVTTGASAGVCSYRSYSPSYSYNNYSYGSYAPRYGHSTYYGYSYHQPGTDYWPGGYFGGNRYWPAGEYYPGWYSSYNNYGNYSSCSYHAPNYAPVVPYIPKFEAAVLLARFPTYGVYSTPEPPPTNPGVAPTAPMGTYAPNYSTQPGYSAPGYVADNSIQGTLKEILVAVKATSSDVAELKAWRISVDQRLGSPPAKVPPTGTESAPPTGAAPAEDVMVAGPNILHTRCATCHDEKKVAAARSKVVLFVTGAEGPEMATRNAKNEAVVLPAKTLQKCREMVGGKLMPPAKDAANKPIPPLTARELATVDQFLAKAISQYNSPAGPEVK